MKAIHNSTNDYTFDIAVVLYLKDTQKWKQFTTAKTFFAGYIGLCYISKILKNESNSQLKCTIMARTRSCVISQRYSKMKAIHNNSFVLEFTPSVVLYLKDTQKWKQFTTDILNVFVYILLCYISKILKNESNSQQTMHIILPPKGCVISQRYSKMKAIHNLWYLITVRLQVVLYLKDTQKWKQFTTVIIFLPPIRTLCYISKILKNESNSQQLHNFE